MNATVDDLLAYLALTAEDVACLRALHPVLAPSFAAICADVCDTILASPGAASALSGTEQVERIRRSLIEWMDSGLLGPYDAGFFERRSCIRNRHLEIELPQLCLFISMNVIRTAYVARIATMVSPSQVVPSIRAINKLLDVELAMMLHHYEAEAEEHLVQRERRLQSERLAAMQTLSSGLAHEIRNPLNSAQLQLDLLDRRLRKNVEDLRLSEPAELARREIERLAELVNEFLAVAQPPAMNVAEHDIVVVAHHALELERPLAIKRGVELEMVTDHEAVLACVDATKLHKIIQNLVRNAVEAAAAGGRVELRLLEQDDRVHVRVDDDGPGIPDRARARLYEPFFTTKEHGTGLGMSIVHCFVTMHGGTIDVTSTPAGTRFDVALPRAGCEERAVSHLFTQGERP